MKYLFYLKNYPSNFTLHGKCVEIYDRGPHFYPYTSETHSGQPCGWGVSSLHTPWSLNTPSSLPQATPHPPGKAASFPFQLGAAQRPQEPSAKAALVRMSKLPQLSGHVESYSFALHEKLKSCPDLMEGNRWGNLSELSHCWSGRW